MNVQQQISLMRNYFNERPYAADTTESAVFWKTTDIMEYLNAAQTHYNAMLNQLDENYNIAITEIANSAINLTTGNLLPPDLQKIKLVTLFVPNVAPPQDSELEIKPIDLATKTRNTNSSNAAYGLINTQWYYQQNFIKLVNWDQNTSRNMRIYYLNRLPALASYNDISQLPDLLHENMVLYGLVKGLLRDKQASLAGEWQKQLTEMDNFAMNTLKPRQTQEVVRAQQREDWQDEFYIRY